MYPSDFPILCRDDDSTGSLSSDGNEDLEGELSEAIKGTHIRTTVTTYISHTYVIILHRQYKSPRIA